MNWIPFTTTWRACEWEQNCFNFLLKQNESCSHLSSLFTLDCVSSWLGLNEGITSFLNNLDTEFEWVFKSAKFIVCQWIAFPLPKYVCFSKDVVFYSFSCVFCFTWRLNFRQKCNEYTYLKVWFRIPNILQLKCSSTQSVKICLQ